MTNFGGVRLLKRLIDVIGSGLPVARLSRDWGSEGFFGHGTSNKKVGISADLVCWRSRDNARSISGCDGRPVTAEAIVDARGDHVHVLTDPVVNKSGRNSRTGERIVGMAHEQMIVLNTERPVGCEAVLKSNTDGAAPAGR